VTGPIRVFVNGTVLDVPAGSTVGDAVGASDPALLGKITGGSAYVTDGRGIEMETSHPIANGAILRVVVRARARSADADA
jgi:hypothetical protein